MQGVLQWVGGAIFLLAAIAAIIVAIPTANAGVRKAFGKVRKWWLRWRYAYMRMEYLQGQILKLQKDLDASNEERSKLENRINNLSTRNRERLEQFLGLDEVTTRQGKALLLLDEHLTKLEQFEADARPLLDSLQQGLLTLRDMRVRDETERQKALEAIRADVATLRERFEKIASGYFPRL